MPKDDDCWPQMTLDECLAFADEWSRSMTIHAGSQGWRVVCMLLAEEVREMRAELDEQCRLLGMGGSREARLMAQLAESQAREAILRKGLELCKFDSLNMRISECEEVRRAYCITSDDSALREMIEVAKAEEREACVRVCEELRANRPMTGAGGLIAEECAAAIRARKG